MSDPSTKFGEDWTKIVVAIVDEMFVRTDRHTQTHTQTYTQVILYPSNAMNCIGQIISDIYIYMCKLWGLILDNAVQLELSLYVSKFIFTL